ncbi:hypothetical protein PUV54_04120 [Hyphococcus flavus]|uniref:Uncharacterized protein n=1 Tax=Hyphococcus flavus TaxID=1866326 RepID=A0AAE9ZCJ0_9PROT|nr:hypothetical protein [Hyphococcus flavus]WDI32378.1 hypothetical protein PUV54_04120 [Hyphococcus flavus]
MKTIFKTMIAAILGAAALGASAAWAKPAHCAHDHDHRSHAADYYDYYPGDRYSRAGPYRDSGVSFSITFGDSRYDDRYDRRGRHYDRGRRNGYRGDRARVVKRQTFNTRYRARIVLVEEVIRTRGGPRLRCTVDARGPQARYVPYKRMRRIANRNCSRRAQVRIVA